MHRHKSGPGYGPHDKLSNSITRRDLERLGSIGIEERHPNLTAIARVDGSGGVHDRDAVARRESTAGHHEGGVSVWKRDRCSRADCCSFARSQNDRIDRHEVGAGVTRVGVTGRRRTRHQHFDVLRHASRLVHGRMGGMNTYRERLWPSPWIIVIAALAIPASLLTFAAIDVVVGAITGLALFAGVVLLATLSAPTIEVANGVLRAGNARIPLSFVGEVTVARRDDARHARGPGLDARAHIVLRPDIDPIARIDLLDPDDPAPYWVVSTRQPERLAAAISAARS